VNWNLPSLQPYDVVILNTLMSATAQWLMRGPIRHRPWFFWGEKLAQPARSRTGVRRLLTNPLQHASGIAGIGTWAARSYQELFPTPLFFNIPYHCDLTDFLAQPRRMRDDDKVVFLFCGQMIARKGLDWLLAAFSQLDERAHLLLVGREAELPRLLSTLPEAVHARVHYAGFQSPSDLPGFFARSDVFVLPSRYDGWGVVVNQAIGAGLPVICSDQVGAGYDLVEEGVNGHRFPVGDVETLRECMQRFLDEPARIDDYGHMSRARAAQWQPANGAAKWVAALTGLRS
jgi:glycosyltransferase involved in cell wall biosynthesis